MSNIGSVGRRSQQFVARAEKSEQASAPSKVEAQNAQPAIAKQPQAEDAFKVAEATGATKTASTALGAKKAGFEEFSKTISPQVANKIQEKAAKANFDNVVKEAMKDGKIDAKEMAQINAAGKNWKTAEQQVKVDQAQKTHDKAVREALADGNVTPEEAKQINEAQSKLQSATSSLEAMKKTDEAKPAQKETGKEQKVGKKDQAQGSKGAKDVKKGKGAKGAPKPAKSAPKPAKGKGAAPGQLKKQPAKPATNSFAISSDKLASMQKEAAKQFDVSKTVNSFLNA